MATAYITIPTRLRTSKYSTAEPNGPVRLDRTIEDININSAIILDHPIASERESQKTKRERPFAHPYEILHCAIYTYWSINYQ